MDTEYAILMSKPSKPTFAAIVENSKGQNVNLQLADGRGVVGAFLWIFLLEEQSTWLCIEI